MNKTKFLLIGFIVAMLTMLVMAASPDFRSFVTTQFSVAGNRVAIKSGAAITNAALTTPTIASFINANHSHLNAAGGGNLDATAIASGILSDSRLSANVTLLGPSIDLSGTEATGILADARFPSTLPAASGANLTSLTAANIIPGGTPPALNLVNGTNYAASNLMSGGQIPIGTLFAATTNGNAGGWLLETIGNTRYRTFNAQSLTNYAASNLNGTVPTSNIPNLSTQYIATDTGSGTNTSLTASTNYGTAGKTNFYYMDASGLWVTNTGAANQGVNIAKGNVNIGMLLGVGMTTNPTVSTMIGPLQIYNTSAQTNGSYSDATGQIHSNAVGSIKFAGGIITGSTGTVTTANSKITHDFTTGGSTNSGNIQAATLNTTGAVTISGTLNAGGLVSFVAGSLALSGSGSTLLVEESTGSPRDIKFRNGTVTGTMAVTGAQTNQSYIQLTNTAQSNTRLQLNGAVTGATGTVIDYTTNGVSKFSVDTTGTIKSDTNSPLGTTSYMTSTNVVLGNSGGGALSFLQRANAQIIPFSSSGTDGIEIYRPSSGSARLAIGSSDRTSIVLGAVNGSDLGFNTGSGQTLIWCDGAQAHYYLKLISSVGSAVWSVGNTGVTLTNNVFVMSTNGVSSAYTGTFSNGVISKAQYNSTAATAFNWTSNNLYSGKITVSASPAYLTNSVATTSSIVLATLNTADLTASTIRAVPSAGLITFSFLAAPTGNVDISWKIESP